MMTPTMPQTATRVRAFAEAVVRHRWWILVLSVLVVVICASGLRKIQFSGNYRVFFSADNPQLQAFDHLQNTYTKTDNVLFVLTPKGQRVFTRDTLAAVEWLTSEAWKMPYSRRVDSITNFQYTHAEGDDLIVQDLVKDGAGFSDAELRRVQDLALAEPLLVNRLLSSRAHVTGINVTIVLPEKAPTEVPEVMVSARALAQALTEKYPEIEVRLTGMIPYNAAFMEQSRGDLRRLTPLMYAVILIVAYLSLRSASATATTFLVIIFSVLTAMGMLGHLGIRMTPPTATAPTIILTLAIADSVHLLSSMLFYMRKGMNKHDALIESLTVNFGAVFLTSITTVIGFLSLNTSEVPPYRDLGNVVAIGVTAAWAYSILLLPALMAVLPVRVKHQPDKKDTSMIRFSDFVVRQRVPLLVVMVLFTVAMALSISRNEFNDNFVEYFDEKVPFRQDNDFTVANLTGTTQLHYSLGAAEAGGISDPAYLAKLEEFEHWFRNQPGVMHVNSIVEIVKRLNKNMHADDPTWYRVPDQRDLAAQYLLLYEMSLPFGLDLNDQINVDKSATRFTVTTGNMTTKELLGLDQSAQDWLRDHAPASMMSTGTGPNVMFAHIGQRNVRSMIGGNLTALLLVSAIIMVAVRSWKIGLISIIPNIVPIVLAFGMWGLLVGQVGLALSVVTALTFGIVVDDTIHFLAKFLHARRDLGLLPAEAARYAFETVGTAMWITSVILVAGFSVLMLSAFELNSSMGIMAAMTIGFALLADYLLLPPLLIWLERKRES